MRTTLTLDPDVAAMIEAELKRSNRTLKAVVNDTLRAGLMMGHKKPRNVVEMPAPLDIGRLKIENLDNIAEVLELIEDDSR